MARLLTTTEAAYYAGIERRRFRDWAAERGLRPTTERQRLGRSYVTLWLMADIIDAARRHEALHEAPPLTILGAESCSEPRP